VGVANAAAEEKEKAVIFRHEKWYDGIILHPAYLRTKRWCEDVALAVNSFRAEAGERGENLSLADFARRLGLHKDTIMRLEHLAPDSPVPQIRVFERLAQYAEEKGRHEAATLFREGKKLKRTRKRSLWGRNERRF
jgi:hypothetical protein